MAGFVITIPAVSIARELWRFGGAGLAIRASRLAPKEAADIGEGAGDLHRSGEASQIWPHGPRGVATAVMLAAVEHLEGAARPYALPLAGVLALTCLPLAECVVWEK
jgi:hypothetical protein